MIKSSPFVPEVIGPNLLALLASAKFGESRVVFGLQNYVYGVNNTFNTFANNDDDTDENDQDKVNDNDSEQDNWDDDDSKDNNVLI